MFIMARRTHDATAIVEILVRRCVVFARKKFLYEPLCMKTKFAVSNHAATYEVSTLAQFALTTVIAAFDERSIGKYLAFRRWRTGSNNFLTELENVQQNVKIRKSSAANESEP
jgi:hypothetical protein